MNKLIAQSVVKGCVVRLYGDANAQQTYAYKLWSPRKTVEFRGFDTLKVAKLIDSDDDATIARVISAYKNGDIKSVAQKAEPQLTIAETPAPNVVPAPSSERVACDVVDIYGRPTGIKALVREPQYADHCIHDDDSESHNEAIAALQTTLDARQLHKQSK